MISFIIVSLLIYYVAGDRLKNTLFEEFKVKYQKSYSSVEEEKRRLKIFMSNMDKAEEMNRANPYAEFGITKFSDLTEEEFKSIYLNEEFFEKDKGSLLSNDFNDEVIAYSGEKVASSCNEIDWRKKGAVTEVKQQGGCGGCWAFSATGSIEGQWFLAGHPLVSLSEQELVSCDPNGGCGGGNAHWGFKWLIENRSGQIVTEASLPFVSKNSPTPKCTSFNFRNLTVGAIIKGFRFISRDEDQMATFVCENGPISIIIDARSWHSYRKGIFTNCTRISMTHNALIVGFDKNNDPPYWIIKNSWGPNWGEDGYLRVGYGTDQCYLKWYPLTSFVIDNNFTNQQIVKEKYSHYRRA